MNSISFPELLQTTNELLSYLSKATPIFITLVGILSFYFREKIKSALTRSVSKDLERMKAEYAKQIADHTSALQRDLESYKVGLIAEAERIKAAQDVRKSMALKVAEKRFSAIAALYEAHLGIDTSICVLVTSERSANEFHIEYFLNQKKELNNRIKKYAIASDGASLFISMKLRQKVLAVREAANTVFSLRDHCDSEPVPKDHPNVKNLLERSIELEEELRQLLGEFEKA